LRVPLRFPRCRRPAILACLLLFLIAGVYGLVNLGAFLAPEDPLQKADAIFVFAGTFVERPLEAADLYRDGYAPVVVITRSTREQDAYEVARRRGATLDDEFTVARDVLRELAVPDAAILSPADVHDNTAQEAATLRELARRERWSRVIVVSSKYHLRRVSLACTRALAGTPVQIIRRGTRYDPSVPGRWWRHRADIRWVVSETPKLLAYALGVRG
jgi:uncharacterized SAM-binding protein YcdF (DUF218 family)